ncbi:hypothetical protein [Natrinema salaciae]|uniref:Uncharacterized protein n=1 Tax=Natrinema salaciae TaxID=1186196 RepID=A0A1H9MWS5_9EURY|nr:hypothetical protein [Natrinema salaciae]SER28152.1 hypothetical protein SAMN04489841_3532 [Natrinema salaciae]
MLHRPLDVSDADRRTLESDRERLNETIDRAVSELLAEVPHGPLREQLELIAFTPNAALPKRTRRPKWELAFLVDRLANASTMDDERRETVLQFSLCVGEYYDIFDDVVDDDVAEGARGTVVATWQVMFPLCTRLVHRLGDDAVDYWTDRAMGLMEAPLGGIRTDPTLERYRAIVDRQAVLFGALTGLCAVVGDHPATVERAEQLGRAYFRFEQFLLDGEQYASGETGGWNLFALADAADALEYVTDCRRDYERACRSLPDADRRALRPLVGVDLDRWAEREL